MFFVKFSLTPMNRARSKLGSGGAEDGLVMQQLNVGNHKLGTGRSSFWLVVRVWRITWQSDMGLLKRFRTSLYTAESCWHSEIAAESDAIGGLVAFIGRISCSISPRSFGS